MWCEIICNITAPVNDIWLSNGTVKLTASNRIQQAERDSLSAQLLTAMEGTAQWEKKEAALEVQLVEVLYCVSLQH